MYSQKLLVCRNAKVYLMLSNPGRKNFTSASLYKTLNLVLIKIGENNPVTYHVQEEDDNEYEFPCYNLSPHSEDVWRKDPDKFSEYGGVMLGSGAGLVSVMWPRIQTMFR